MTTSDLAESPQTTLRSALREVLDATLEFANSKVAQKADDITEDLKDVGEDVEGDLDDIAASGGAVEQAGYEGVKAGLHGKNPVWAAIMGAWAGASVKVRIAAVLIVLLILLLAPVVLVLLLLGLLIAALVAAIRAATR